MEIHHERNVHIANSAKNTIPKFITQPPDYNQIVPTLKSNKEQMRKCITIDLLTASQREANFLRMIDRKASILYKTNVVLNAIRRYECFWLPMQVKIKLILN